ncbi:hypothetical protein DFH09DRAFT_1364815 [Mycena vulgaris]|nr:hypothetical protein DFH09DRAFT_1364815 [Mycena vulgaris]
MEPELPASSAFNRSYHAQLNNPLTSLPPPPSQPSTAPTVDTSPAHAPPANRASSVHRSSSRAPAPSAHVVSETCTRRATAARRTSSASHAVPSRRRGPQHGVAGGREEAVPGGGAAKGTALSMGRVVGRKPTALYDGGIQQAVTPSPPELVRARH